jgi:hypothetical protein
MASRKRITSLSVLSLVIAGFALGLAQEKGAPKEQERKVTEKEVPAPALAALKKLAGGAAFTEFAEEIEHGHKFYEGSWKGPDGNVDALVTEPGDLVEMEEAVAAEKVPAPARAAAQKEAGKDAKLMWEKKTVVMYEVHFKKNGKGQEMILTPDGRRFHEEGGEKDAQDQDEDEEDGNKERGE